MKQVARTVTTDIVLVYLRQHDMFKLPRFTIIAAFVGTIAPSTASAATWVESLTAKPDNFQGGSGLNQNFVVTNGGMKVQGLAYHAHNPEQGQTVRYARRAVEWGVPLEEGDWEFSDADYQATNNAVLGTPHLAQDRVTGIPYMAYAARIGYEPPHAKLSSFVGNSNGNCGENFDWHCDDVFTVCGMDPALEYGPQSGPRVELESMLGEPADAAHVMFQIKGAQDGDFNRLLHARKDLASQSWTCQIVPGAGMRHDTSMRSTSIFHTFDGRLKPMLTYAVTQRVIPKYRQVIRSLVDYAGLPLPSVSWTQEFPVASPSGFNYGTPALAVRDEGLGPEGYAMPSGIGLPAIAEVHAYSQSLPPWPDCSSNPGTWSLDYRVATDEAASGWEPTESVVTSRPCGPTMAFGWEMTPHILYVEDGTDLMLTARRSTGRQLWTSPVQVAAAPPNSNMQETDVIFDPDFGTVSAVYVDAALGYPDGVIVVDGYLED